MDPFYHEKTRYFFGFCVVEEVYLVVLGNAAILEFIIFYLLFMLIYGILIRMAQIFYRDFLSYLRV